MYLPPLVGLVWDWSFCCEYKYLVTWQYKQALAGRAVLTTRKGVGTSVTIRNSSMFVSFPRKNAELKEKFGRKLFR